MQVVCGLASWRMREKLQDQDAVAHHQGSAQELERCMRALLGWTRVPGDGVGTGNRTAGLRWRGGGQVTA